MKSAPDRACRLLAVLAIFGSSVGLASSDVLAETTYLIHGIEGFNHIELSISNGVVTGETATAALRFALQGETQVALGEKVSGLFAFVTIFFPIALIACIALVFAAVYKEVSGFGPDQMKITLGGIETFFGVFLGAISDTLFGAGGSATVAATKAVK